MMGDKSNIAREKVKKLQIETKVSRKTILKKYKKNFKRKNRRRRSRRAYFNMLRKERVVRGTQDLCNTLEEFNVVDMDMQSMGDRNKLPEAVIEWQKRDQIAYWKSRAIALEIENKTLRQHLRNVYAQQIEYYENKADWHETPNTSDEAKKINDNQISDNAVESGASNHSKKNEQEASSSGHKTKVLPKEPIGKNRLIEMEKIYGDMAPKIMGMETAIQLNYDRLVEQGSPGYWPNIPLKL